MGNMLDDSYASASDEVDDKDLPDAPEPEAAEPEVAAQVARTPITRRQRAKDRDESILKELSGLKESLGKQGETYREELARISRENAELRGHVQGLSQSYRERPAEREEPAADPNKLLREANAALDAKDFSGYQEKYADYILAKQAADPRFRQAPQPQAQQQTNPMLQMVASQYVDVISNPDALDAAQTYDRRLARAGMPEGPERWKKSFEEGRRLLGAAAPGKAPTFSTKNRDVLSGAPRGGSQGGEGGGEPGVMLTPLERQMAKRFKMSESDYARELAAMRPDRVER